MFLLVLIAFLLLSCFGPLRWVNRPFPRVVARAAVSFSESFESRSPSGTSPKPNVGGGENHSRGARDPRPSCHPVNLVNPVASPLLPICPLRAFPVERIPVVQPPSALGFGRTIPSRSRRSSRLGSFFPRRGFSPQIRLASIVHTFCARMASLVQPPTTLGFGRTISSRSWRPSRLKSSSPNPRTDRRPAGFVRTSGFRPNGFGRTIPSRSWRPSRLSAFPLGLMELPLGSAWLRSYNRLVSLQWLRTYRLLRLSGSVVQSLCGLPGHVLPPPRLPGPASPGFVRTSRFRPNGFARTTSAHARVRSYNLGAVFPVMLSRPAPPAWPFVSWVRSYIAFPSKWLRSYRLLRLSGSLVQPFRALRGLRGYALSSRVGASLRRPRWLRSYCPFNPLNGFGRTGLNPPIPEFPIPSRGARMPLHPNSTSAGPLPGAGA